MADTNKLKTARPQGSRLDKAMAGFLAASVAFVSLTMPGDIFAGLVGATGLPSLVPAAQPPLGTTARLIAAAAGAVAAFVLVSALLSALNKPARSRRHAGNKPVEAASEPPRLRRADAHPDAPSRSPILAGRELGVPLDEMAIEERPTADLADVENVDFEAEWERPLPGFIDEEPRAETGEAVDWEPVNDILDPTAFTTAVPPDVADAPEPEAPLAALPVESTASEIPFWVPPGGAPVEAVEPEFEASTAPEAAEPPMTVPFRKSRPRPEPSAALPELADRLPEAGAAGSEGVDALVERFERGLGQREALVGPGTSNSDLDRRLRSALGELRKISRR